MLIDRTQQDGVLTLTLNRPQALNALSLAAWAELEQAIAYARDDDNVRALLITGAGKAFSAGGDIKEMRPDRTSAEQRERLRLINRTILALYRLEKPTIAAVNGVAAGNGCSLALSCDLVLAAAGASFVLSFVRLGLVPDAGATWLLPRLIGERRAKELVMTARRLDAAEALEWGLISRVVPDDALAGEALELACRLATGPALALGLGKRLVADAPQRTFEEALEAESLAQGLCVVYPDYREGVAAFLEKREPNF